MIIQYERSGGFAGMVQRAVIDSDQLDPQERQQLQGLLAQADFFNPARAGGGGASRSDQMHYSLKIKDGAQERAVELDEDQVPPEWQALLQQVGLLARRFRSP
jgi:hypothetical protein